jgi:hypothetical protein
MLERAPKPIILHGFELSDLAVQGEVLRIQSLRTLGTNPVGEFRPSLLKEFHLPLLPLAVVVPNFLA